MKLKCERHWIDLEPENEQDRAYLREMFGKECERLVAAYKLPFASGHDDTIVYLRLDGSGDTP